MSNSKYPVLIYWDSRTSKFMAYSDEYPTINAMGYTREDALKNLKKIIEGKNYPWHHCKVERYNVLKKE